MSQQQKKQQTKRPQRKKSNNKNNKNKQRRSRPQRGPRRIAALQLSTCAKSFAHARLDPFKYSAAELPCIPDNLDTPSMKFMTKYSGVAITGSGNYGFVLVAPFTKCNDYAATWHSAANFSSASGIIPGTAATTGTIPVEDSQYPFTFDEARNVRVVACGLRIRYIGTELARGGRLLLASTQAADGSMSGMSFTTMKSRPESRTFAVEKKWVTVSYNPCYADAFSYDSVCYPLHVSSASNAKMVAMFESSPGNSFEFEVITYYEATSYNDRLVSGVSKSHSDPVGYGAVKDFLGGLADTVVTPSSYNEFLKSAAKIGANAGLSYFGVPASSIALIDAL